jgi:hypothetical protein
MGSFLLGPLIRLDALCPVWILGGQKIRTVQPVIE